MASNDNLREIQHRVMFEDLYNRMENAELKMDNLDDIVSLSKILVFMGSATNAELRKLKDSAKTGQVYNILDNGTIGQTGDNVVWNGSDWDLFGSSVSIEGYATENYVDEKINTVKAKYNITISTAAPVNGTGSDGDIWIKYTPSS